MKMNDNLEPARGPVPPLEDRLLYQISYRLRDQLCEIEDVLHSRSVYFDDADLPEEARQQREAHERIIGLLSEAHMLAEVVTDAALDGT